METGLIILLSINLVILLVILYKVFLSKGLDENSVSLNIIKNINDENERNRASLTNSLNEFRKEMNDVSERLNKKSNEDREALNNEFEKVRTNLETKLENEFNKVNKTFVANNEKLEKINKEFRESEIKVTRTINENLKEINERVELSLEKGFEKANKTFINITEKITKIDEAQKNIENLSTEIISLQDVLNDKKARGSFGEVQLSLLLNANFGENNTDLFELQKSLPNGKIVDAYLKMPNQYGNIAIDSKFPLENYRLLKDEELSEKEQNEAKKRFIQDVKKHVNDISSKYIIEGVTASQAIMFIPSEAVFAEINAYYDELIVYANRYNVSITSPTTLMALLKVVLLVYKDYRLNKNAKIIAEELTKLGKDFKLYSKRWAALQTRIKQVSEEAKKIDITTGKITNKFNEISDGFISTTSKEELEEVKG